MTIFCQPLTVSIPLLKEGVDVTALPKIINNKQSYITYLNIDEVVNPDMLTFLKSLGIEPLHCEIFYSVPNFFSGIHVDIKHGDFTKINWVFGGSESVMNWYRPKNNFIRDENAKTVIDTAYIPYWRDEVEVIHSSQLITPSIVQVGVPHNIKNANEPRYCVSLVLSTIKDGNIYRPTMAESLSILTDYIAQ
jgi:hypothetical protein